MGVGRELPPEPDRPPIVVLTCPQEWYQILC